MTERADILVIGAGPAGIGAAVTAAARGLSVALVDLAETGGGQVYRAPPRGYRLPPDFVTAQDIAAGDRLRDELESSPVRRALGHTLWSIAPGFHAHTVGPEGLTEWQTNAVIAATGTHERVIPFPGWTLPGIIGLAAATVLLKSQQTLPGTATVVAGCGPLLALVAASILKGGGRVVAVVDLAGPGEWFANLRVMASRPRLLARGLGWMRAIRAAGAPYLFRHAVVEARGGDAVDEVLVAPVDGDGRPRPGRGHRAFKVDSLTVGHGLVPTNEVTRLLGARHVYRPRAGGWIPEQECPLRTSVENLYVAGDCAGIAGAESAVSRGRLAGLMAALDMGAIDRDGFSHLAAPHQAELRRVERFGRTMAGMMALRPGLLDTVTADTMVCRCEEVSRAEIDSALADGVCHVNQLKAWTRCGMGPCQGRMCGETAASLVAANTGGRARAGQWTARVPIRPVAMESLLGDYTYDDIPTPPPAPA